MDTLSDLLRAVRFSGGVFLEATFSAPWCVRTQIAPQDCGPRFRAGGGLVAFHYVLDGCMQVRLGKEEPRAVGPGEIIVLSHNDPHLLGSDVTIPAVEGRPLMKKAEEHELARINFGAGPVRNCFVCGFLATTMQNNPLLVALPPLLVADLRGRPCADWAETSFRYAAREHASRRPGSQEILARLSEMLFVEAVRGYIEALPGNATGWLVALRPVAVARTGGAAYAPSVPLDCGGTGEGSVPLALGVCGTIHEHRQSAAHELSHPLANAAGGPTTAGVGRHHRAGCWRSRLRIRVYFFARLSTRNGPVPRSLA